MARRVRKKRKSKNNKRKQSGRGLKEKIKQIDKEMTRRLIEFLDKNANANKFRNLVRKK